jgi:hypothetical protein
MMSGRNIPYVLNRTYHERFDNVVSRWMEPALVAEAASLFRSIPGISIVQNHGWGQGEIDLLVYSSDQNAALHIQAKAALPPEGARMVKALEDRVAEGLRQLNIFRCLPQTRVDAILSSALKQRVEHVRVYDALLCISSYGTHRVWSRLGDVAPLNPLIIAGIVQRIEKTSGQPSLAGIRKASMEIVEEIVRGVNPEWNETELPIGDYRIRYPILYYDEDAFFKERARLWFPRVRWGRP